MFKKLFKNKIAQTTAEYALLISLVVAAVIAMQTYAQRAIQARIRGATLYMTEQTSALGTVNQYEAYYASSNYDVDRTNTDVSIHNNETISVAQNEIRARKQGGTTNTERGDIIDGI
jgi:uncharacterized protein (UPF0333 family)